MMIGIGTPRNHKSIERMLPPRLKVNFARAHKSRRRPPYVAIRLATKAPMSIDTTSQSDA